MRLSEGCSVLRATSEARAPCAGFVVREISERIEPLVRVMIEAPTQERCKQISEHICGVVARELSTSHDAPLAVT